MPSLRQNKVSRLLQKELAEIFQKELRNVFGSGIISVTHVFVSPDMGFAKTYLSLFGVPDKEKMLGSIRKQVREVRRALGARVGKQLRVVPEIAFFVDDSGDYADKMEKVFSTLTISPEPAEPEVKATSARKKKAKE
ncbi:MAG: 30S ribosome-binding factor RbfA [Bacteroidetes bacterium]|nr:MAG: 30S ribosome-binding factor RbfA [Bacteroidota bacterium]